MSIINSMERLFSLHGELGYFDLFQGQIKLPLMILGPRGFGKSELFYLLTEQFRDEYVKFIPIASDGIIFEYDVRKGEMSFFSKGTHISIRGRDGLDWDRKVSFVLSFDKEFKISLNEFKFGILLVGALGIENKSKYREIVRERGHKINFKTQMELIRIQDPERYLFSLIQEMILNPAHWEQLVIHKKLKKIEGEFRLINKIVGYLPQRVLELTLPELENKWGQLNNVFKSLVFQMDRLIISSVEFKLSKMIRSKTLDLISQIQHEWRFPDDKQLPNLSGIPEILTIKQWLDTKIEHQGSELKLPSSVAESIELGLLSIQTAFVEELEIVLKKGHSLKVDEIRKLLTVHAIAIGDLINSLVDKKKIQIETFQRIKETESDIGTIDNFLKDVEQGNI
ncbi:MAG: hypothetical protein ACFFAU_04450 [Candidatus Hodarchaeota archaeon]